MCAARSLRDVLQYVVPLTQTALALTTESRRPESKLMKLEATKSATVPRSSHYQKPPPVPPRKDAQHKVLCFNKINKLK